jgi:uncharacterized protein (UPF0303 family)
MATDGIDWPAIEELEQQEAELVLRQGDLASLVALGRGMTDAAAAAHLPVVIHIRAGGRLVFAAALPGSTASNDDWATCKARVAQHFEHSSLLVRLIHERDGLDVNAHHGLPPDAYRAHGGAFPLRVEGVGMIGTVVVSGLPQVDDHAFVVEQLAAFVDESR